MARYRRQRLPLALQSGCAERNASLLVKPNPQATGAILGSVSHGCGGGQSVESRTGMCELKWAMA